MKKRAGVFEHDPRLFAFINQLRNEVADAFVALLEDPSVVVVALA